MNESVRWAPLFVRYFFLLLFVVVWSACGGSRRAALPEETPALFPNHSAPQIVRAMAAHADTIRSYSGKASVQITSERERQSFTMNVNHRAEDRLAATMTVGPGIGVARALVTPDSFFVYDRIKKRLYFNGLASVQNALPIPVAFDDLMPNLLGLVRPAAGVAWQVEADTVLYTLTSPDGRVRFRVDPRIWRTRSIEFLDVFGRVTERRLFDRFDLFEGLYLPRRLIFERPLDRQQFSLYFRSLDLNPTSLDLRFDADGARERVLFPPPEELSDE